MSEKIDIKKCQLCTAMIDKEGNIISATKGNAILGIALKNRPGGAANEFIPLTIQSVGGVAYIGVDTSRIVPANSVN